MGLLERLEGLSVLGIDTAVFIYHLEAHPRYLPLTKLLFERIETGKVTAVTSTLTLTEICVVPYRAWREDVARKYEALLTNFPNLMVADMDREVARRAAQLRAKYTLRTPDALQLACGLVHGIQTFVSNDHALVQVNPDCPVLLLDDCF